VIFNFLHHLAAFGRCCRRALSLRTPIPAASTACLTAMCMPYPTSTLHPPTCCQQHGFCSCALALTALCRAVMPALATLHQNCRCCWQRSVCAMPLSLQGHCSHLYVPFRIHSCTIRLQRLLPPPADVDGARAALMNAFQVGCIRLHICYACLLLAVLTLELGCGTSMDADACGRRITNWRGRRR
jgi:hypothetical protein